MKFVYVLVSSEKDFYAEEALVSMFTLRKHNPEAEVFLVSDSLTIASLKEKRGEIKKLTTQILKVDAPEDFSLIQKSRFLKTSIREYIKDTFLYIDNDTLITGSLDNLKNITCEVGAVYNQHKENWNDFKYHPMMLEYKHATGDNPEEQTKFSAYFNGGIIFSRDTPDAHKFFKKWHELWLKESIKSGFHKDQPTMWHANYLCGNIITPIDGIYNFQAIYPEHSFKYLMNCKIFHYFSSSVIGKNIVFRKPEFMNYVKTHGIDCYVENCVNNFLSDYIDGLKILADDEIDLYNSPMAVFGRKVSQRFPSSNKFIKRIFGNKVI